MTAQTNFHRCAAHHPTERVDGSPRKRSVACLLGISPLLFCLTGCHPAESDVASASPPSSTRPVAVRTALARKENVVSEITLVGTVTAIRRSIVGSPVEGRVTQLNVGEGDLVEMVSEGDQLRGEPIAQLCTEPISIEIAAATAELTRLQHELAELKAGSRPEEITQAKAQWEAAKAANEYAAARIRRAQQLIERNALSADEFDIAQSAALAAKQNLIAAEAGYQMAESGPRSEQIAQAVAKVDQQQQEIARLNAQLRYHTIRAPFGGYVVRKLTEVGQWLTRGDPVAEIVELDPIDVMIHVPESLVTQLNTGDEVPLKFDALPDGSDSFPGTIRGIVPSADQRARTFPVRIQLANPARESGHLLRDGMQARATLSGSPRPTILVPKDALILGGPNPVVMVAQESADGKTVAVRLEVEAGVARGGMIEVHGDLQPGQQVIVSGNERVQAGQVLSIIADVSGVGVDEPSE